jgi:flavin-dependent dehydrogenase
MLGDMDERCDVAIAGGGPAGAALALLLGQAGLRVVVLERKRFPRFKPCGEFMSPECLVILRELGVRDDVGSLGCARVSGMRLCGYGRTATGKFAAIGRAQAPLPFGWAVRRERFDAVLLRAAAATRGVEVREATAVAGLLRDSRGGVCGVRVRDRGGETSIAAAIVVGADGLRSPIARALGVQRPLPWLDKVALTTRFAGVDARDCAEVHLFPGGYFAATTVDDGLFTLNLVVDRATVAKRGRGWDEFLAAHLERAPALGDRLRGAVRVDPVRGCGPLAMQTTAQVSDGAALVGDACGYVDPLTGEGIFFALRGAQLLAPVVVAAFRAGRRDARALRGYERARAAEFAPRLFLARCLQRGLTRPAVVAHVLALLSRRPRLADLLVAVTGDYVPGRELLRPSVWWRALGRAEAS